MTTWEVRPEGSRRPPRLFSSAQAVADALKDGEIAPADEIRSTSQTEYQSLDLHPAFAEIVADLEEPPLVAEEETHLDMNPLIDVALVLLIFFIITATYATLSRSLNLPPEPEREGAAARNPTRQELKDRTVTVSARQETDSTVFRVEGKVVRADDLEGELTVMIRVGNRKDAFFDVGPGVPWGAVVRMFEAARGAEVRNVWRPPAKK